MGWSDRAWWLFLLGIVGAWCLTIMASVAWGDVVMDCEDGASVTVTYSGRYLDGQSQPQQTPAGETVVVELVGPGGEFELFAAAGVPLTLRCLGETTLVTMQSGASYEFGLALELDSASPFRRLSRSFWMMGAGVVVGLLLGYVLVSRAI